MKLTDSKRVAAALEALRSHEQREIALQQRYADAVGAADNLASDLGAAVLEDPGREAKAAGELAKARAAVELLGRAVERAEQDRLKLQAAVALARAVDCRERATELRAEHEGLAKRVEALFDEVERLEGVRPADMPSGSNSDRLWREFQSLEDTAQSLEADLAGGYSSVVESLKIEAAG